ncbi:MAG: Rab family GTPase [Promethearchaeota archaeon]
MLKYKIVLGGSKNVGKSSLLARFCDNVFDEGMKDTIGVAFKRKILKVRHFNKDIDVDLVIWDFGGEEKYRTVFPKYVQKAAGAFILFDLTRPETLDDVINWIEIVDNNADDVVKVLIGSKCDLVEQRRIPRETVDDFIRDNAIDVYYMETSSKTGENVVESFEKMTKSIIENKLNQCPCCAELINKNLKICSFCGAKIA